jgi:hypothetical protein
LRLLWRSISRASHHRGETRPPHSEALARRSLRTPQPTSVVFRDTPESAPDICP